MSAAQVVLVGRGSADDEPDLSSIPAESGVYAAFDEAGQLQYIGLSRDMLRSVEGHSRALGAADAAGNAAMAELRFVAMPGAEKEALTATWQLWINGHLESGGAVPAGNLPEGAPGADKRWRRGARAPPKAGPGRELLLGGGAGGQPNGWSMDTAVDVVKDAVERHPVVLFMKGTPGMPQCGFSARSVAALGEIGVPFEAVNVLDFEANPLVRDAVKEFSGWPTLPQLFAGGALLGGADAIVELHSSGELAPLLRSAAAGAGAVDEVHRDGPAVDTSATGAGAPPADAAVAAARRRGSIEAVEDPERRPTATQISALLRERFDLYGLKIVDESSFHEGDAGALEMGLTEESHFSVQIVALEFAGLPPVQRQQLVHTALKEVMPKIHALSLVTRTPDEVAGNKL